MSSPSASRARALGACGLLLAAVLWAFHPLWLAGGGVVVSKAGEDLTQLFAPWRQFGFSRLRQGRLALWDPSLFCGMPYLGNFESALLYPPNWLYLALPLAAAINTGVALHVLLAGLFTFGWCRCRGCGIEASLLAGLMFMFSGPYFLHVYAGHLPYLCAAAWAPAVFWALEGWLRDGTAGWWLFGAFAAAMQIFAGFPQVVYYTALAAALYCALRLAGSKDWRRLAAGAAGMFATAALLAAVQLLAGIQAAHGSERAAGIPFDLARTFSFPPENLATLVAPGLFGDMARLPYYGRWRLWEACLFISLAGLAAAAQAVLGRRGKQERLAALMALSLLLLAFGAYTPLFGLLYRWLPGFDLFRGAAKFSLLAALFLCALAAAGFDELAARGPARGTVAAVFLACLGLLAAGARQLLAARGGPAALAGDGLFRGVLSGRDRLFALAPSAAPLFLKDAARFAAAQLFLAAAVLGSIGLILWLALRRRAWSYALLPVAALELLFFAGRFFATASLTVPRIALPTDAAGPEQARVLHSGSSFPDIAMSLGQYDVWGYAPLVPRRYAEMTESLQRVDPRLPPRIAALLRLRYVVRDDLGRVKTLPPGLGRVELIPGWELRQSSAAALAALEDPGFDPRKTVILESVPDPAPTATGALRGDAEVLDSGTDWLDIAASVPQPALLLITDNFAEGWRARAYPDSSQKSYRILLGDYTLRAIPLAAGTHHLRVEYAPAAFRAGAWLSLASWPCFLGFAGWNWLRRRRAA